MLPGYVGPCLPDSTLINTVHCCRKRINLHWQHWARSVPAMEGLDDVLRYDLSPFCRKMEPAHEAYLRCVGSLMDLIFGGLHA